MNQCSTLLDRRGIGLAVLDNKILFDTILMRFHEPRPNNPTPLGFLSVCPLTSRAHSSHAVPDSHPFHGTPPRVRASCSELSPTETFATNGGALARPAPAYLAAFFSRCLEFWRGSHAISTTGGQLKQNAARHRLLNDIDWSEVDVLMTNHHLVKASRRGRNLWVYADNVTHVCSDCRAYSRS